MDPKDPEVFRTIKQRFRFETAFVALHTAKDGTVNEAKLSDPKEWIAYLVSKEKALATGVMATMDISKELFEIAPTGAHRTTHTTQLQCVAQLLSDIHVYICGERCFVCTLLRAQFV